MAVSGDNGRGHTWVCNTPPQATAIRNAIGLLLPEGRFGLPNLPEDGIISI